MQIITDRLTIRPHTLEDADSFAKMNADPKVMEYFPSPFSRDESDQSLQRMMEHQQKHGYSFCAVEFKGAYAGFVGLLQTQDTMPFPVCTEIGWRIRSEFWRQGIAHEAATAWLSYGFKTLHLDNIVSYTPAINKASWGLMEKLGMQKRGEFSHPLIPEDDRLNPMALYRISRRETIA